MAPRQVSAADLKAALFKGDPPERKSRAWDALCDRMEAMAGQEVCGAKTRSGWPCTNVILGTGKRCKMHGGASYGPGPDHPKWKHGRSSLVASRLPARFRETFQNFVNDPELLSLRPEIAVLDERFYELLDKLDTGESASAWAQALVIVEALESELEQPNVDLDAVQDLVRQLSRQVLTGQRYGSLWREIGDTAKTAKELRATESMRLKDAGASMGAQDVLGIVHQLLDLVFLHVADKTAIQRIFEAAMAKGLLPEVDDLKALGTG